MNTVYGSIDVGLHNLAIIIEEKDKIIFTQSKNLTNKNCVDNSVLINLTNYLDSVDFLKKCNIVLIEKQLGTKNHKAKRLENHIHSWFLIKLPDINVILFPSSNKTKVLGAPKMTKYQRKKWAVEKTKEILKERGDDENYNEIFSKKKADDESDAFLQLQAYKIKKRIINVEGKDTEDSKSS